MADGATAFDASTALPVPEAASPEVKGGVVAYLSLADAAAAADFYARAFGAVEVARMAAPGDTRLCHVHLHLNDTSLMLSDAFPEHGCPLQTPGGFNLMLPVDDAAWRRAVEGGRRGRHACPGHVLGRPLRPGARPLRRDMGLQPGALTAPGPPSEVGEGRTADAG